MAEEDEKPPRGPAPEPRDETGRDPELSSLPKPRRPWRLATLVSLSVLFVAALGLAFMLRSQVAYALTGGDPSEVGALASFDPAPEAANTWVHGSGNLSVAASGYRRPLDDDRFRLAPVEGNPKLWVELREPSGVRNEFFVPPTSFVGRLVPIEDPGLRHSQLTHALKTSNQNVPPRDAWLLIDGEAPHSSRWALGVCALLLGFAAFSVWGMITLLRPAGQHAH